MSGLNLGAIREALATQIQQGVSRETESYPVDENADQYPQFLVRPATGDYVDYFETFGQSGESHVNLEVVIRCRAAEGSSAELVMDDYLSAGQGNNSSVVDAIMSDRTLSGVVGDIVGLTASDWSVNDGLCEAVINVLVLVRKVSAAV